MTSLNGIEIESVNSEVQELCCWMVEAPPHWTGTTNKHAAVLERVGPSGTSLIRHWMVPDSTPRAL
jgi:hypothetical protein